MREFLRDIVKESGAHSKEHPRDTSEERIGPLDKRNRDKLRKDRGFGALYSKSKTGSIERILSIEKSNLLIAPSQPLQPHMEDQSKSDGRSKRVTPI